ncbi:Hpt domain-containing protein [Hyphomicrobium sp.]|jgi:HPt (histidine-containing phosphotransfer) domain-containing protein|uniref:Hpt domain-containing protein n=1 Tax=Hyphomicrobium sp. TaxID=82 RepID=UPI002BCF8DF4|nr:Hpt domain-containing protein [Hyphomicrobium sp.]HVZ06018.1 Hpt domain-containing protein [Hyphomicrobium sp.]
MQAIARRPTEAPASDDAVPAASGPLDIQHLRRYTFGDQALEKEILSLFLAQLPETIAALRAAANQRDWKVAAHTLKGSSRAVGAFRLGDIAQEAEQLTYGADAEVRADAICRLQEAASEARSFIQATYGLNERP